MYLGEAISRNWERSHIRVSLRDQLFVVKGRDLYIPFMKKKKNILFSDNEED